jgi:iron complex transport system ATP-binding protein
MISAHTRAASPLSHLDDGLVARSLSVQVGRTPLVQQVSVAVVRGQVLGILGANGAGKSSLVKCLAGIHAFCGGNLSCDGKAKSQYTPREWGQKVGYMAQDHICHWPMRVRDVVQLGARQTGATGMDYAAEAINRLQLEDLQERDVFTLSGGERARVMLARCLAGAPDYILADEPVAGLDPFYQLDIMAALHEQAAQHHKGVAVVLHDLTLAARYCDVVLLLQNGQSKACGSAEDVLTPDIIESVYGVRCVFGQSFSHMQSSGQGQDAPFIVPMRTI